MTSKKLESGFKLFQPWANEVVEGNLTHLIRSHYTSKRERVAVIASKSVDKEWFKNAELDKIRSYENKVGIIGSVDIADCERVKKNNLRNEIIERAGKEYWDYYPKYLIPEPDSHGEIKIWVLEKPKVWKKIKQTKGGGIIWSPLNVEDE